MAYGRQGRQTIREAEGVDRIAPALARRGQPHPWDRGSFKMIDRGYLDRFGIESGSLPIGTIDSLMRISQVISKRFSGGRNRPPLLSRGEEYESRDMTIPSNADLPIHRNTDSCPMRTFEINHTDGGCQINCQYCLAIAQEGFQDKILILRGIGDWLREKLSRLRANDGGGIGTVLYFGAKTEALSPQMVREGITQDVLLAFSEHVEMERRARGRCSDTMMIITKAGSSDLDMRGPEGRSTLEILRSMPDNVQVSTSLTHLGSDPHLREAIEPGARTVEERLGLVRKLQKEGILAQGALVQPILPCFAPNERFWEMLLDSGIGRVSIDVYSTTLQNLALMSQIIGWFDESAERMMWGSYLSEDAMTKGALRKGMDRKRQKALFEQMIRSARQAGFRQISYCRSVQSALGLPKLAYKEPSPGCPEASGGCMANITRASPKSIRQARSMMPLAVEDS